MAASHAPKLLVSRSIDSRRQGLHEGILNEVIHLAHWDLRQQNSVNHVSVPLV
jgi:hypothetical protein